MRTRFFQQLFPGCKFIIILRHPIAVAYATRKWSRTSIASLVRHSLRCYQRFREDLPFLNAAHVLRYEDFVLAPQSHMSRIYEWIGVDPRPLQAEVRSNVNAPYFAAWESDRRSIWAKLTGSVSKIIEEMGTTANLFGYRLDAPEELLPLSWLGPHTKGQAKSNLRLSA